MVIFSKKEGKKSKFVYSMVRKDELSRCSKKERKFLYYRIINILKN